MLIFGRIDSLNLRIHSTLVEVVLILLFLFPFTLNQKKPVHTEDLFNDEHQERQEVEMLAKKFEMKYVSIIKCSLYPFGLISFYDWLGRLKISIAHLILVSQIESK